jgi:hypothetical protein
MWYVVCDKHADAQEDPAAKIWTLSRSSTQPGWETDNGYQGYGLAKADARFLANAANAITKYADEGTILVQKKDGTNWTEEDIRNFQLEWDKADKGGNLRFVTDSS